MVEQIWPGKVEMNKLRMHSPPLRVNGIYSGEKCLFIPKLLHLRMLISSLFLAAFCLSGAKFDRAKRGFFDIIAYLMSSGGL